MWNRLGTKIIPKLRQGTDLRVDVGFSVTSNAEFARSVENELLKVLKNLGLEGQIRIELKRTTVSGCMKYQGH